MSDFATCILVVAFIVFSASITHCAEKSNELRLKCLDSGHDAEDCAKAVHQ